MKIIVTQDHIDKGIPKKCWSCPIALAIKSAGLKDITVNTLYILIHRGRKYLEYGEEKDFHIIKFPIEVSNFIYDFDNGKENLKPFEFELQYNP